MLHRSGMSQTNKCAPLSVTGPAWSVPRKFQRFVLVHFCLEPFYMSDIVVCLFYLFIYFTRCKRSRTVSQKQYYTHSIYSWQCCTYSEGERFTLAPNTQGIFPTTYLIFKRMRWQSINQCGRLNQEKGATSASGVSQNQWNNKGNLFLVTEYKNMPVNNAQIPQCAALCNCGCERRWWWVLESVTLSGLISSYVFLFSDLNFPI